MAGEFTEELTSHGVRAWTQTADVSDPDAVRAFVDETARRFGGLDVVINNAGLSCRTAVLTDSWDKCIEDFQRVVGVNLYGTYLVGRAAIPHIARQGGDIVNVVTDHIHTCGYPQPVDHSDAPDCPWAHTRRRPLGGAAFDVYDASKWAVKGLTTVWAEALASHGVRVNSFGMGSTDTPMLRAGRGDAPLPEDTKAPEEVAAVLIELLAEGPTGRTADSVQLWRGHPTQLPPVGLDGILGAMPQKVWG
jgi:3-oxoacyl-[acyl-carrier protein] reductase